MSGKQGLVEVQDERRWYVDRSHFIQDIGQIPHCLQDPLPLALPLGVPLDGASLAVPGVA